MLQKQSGEQKRRCAGREVSHVKSKNSYSKTHLLNIRKESVENENMIHFKRKKVDDIVKLLEVHNVYKKKPSLVNL